MVPPVEVHKVAPQRDGQSGRQQHTPCHRCGKKNHAPATCRFRNAKCHNCGRTGHLKAVCYAPPREVGSATRRQRRPKNVQLVQKAASMEESDEYSLYKVHGAGRAPFRVNIEVEGQQLPMEIDTGASLSLISEATWKRLWPNKRLLPSTVKLRMYTGEPLSVRGSMLARVKHGKHEAQLTLLVVRGEGPSLLGRDWLQQLQLDWYQVHQVHASSLEEVLERHAEVFKEGLGTLKGHEITIHVDQNVTPRYCKARSVPYSMRALVDKQLDHLVSQGVIEPIQYAEWAAPIVPVLKSDKQSVRICGDFKLTVNRASKLDCYPIPKIEDLLAKLAGGKTFSQLDLSQAYQQLPLDQKSKSYVVINTQRGLFRYNRLPYGVSSAPGIFQRTMENILQGIPYVVVYLDDILITGPTPQEHIRVLEEVLTRLKKSKCSFMAPSVIYLGHHIDAEGLHPVADKVKAVNEAPRPSNVSELKSY